jgi:tetratricopeptide (TPR) repeat protein
MHPGRDADEPTLGAALSALREGDLAAAEAIGRHLLLNMPDDPAVHQLAAAIALQRGETEQAARSAAASLARRPDHFPTLVIAGRAARASGDLAAALAFFRRATALAPDRADAAFLTCVTLLELGDAEARTLLPRLLDRFPDDAEGWRLLGGALQRANQPEAALVSFTRAAQSMPSSALHVRRGMLLQSLGRLAEAVDAFRAAADLEPENVDAVLQLGLSLRRAGDAENASVALERAATLGPTSAEVWFALGLVRQDERDFASAAEAYRRAIENRPDLAEAAVNLGICHQEAGDMAAAKAAYRVALRLRPDTFGRIAQALAAAPVGEVWLDLAALRHALAD